METYSPNTYGDHIAAVYDDLYPEYDEAAIHRLVELAHGGRALELGIGTGRFALPLQQMGVEVHGIDASAAMVERLRAKPGADRIPVTIGDFKEIPVEGEFTLIYVVFTTFFGLLTQEDQVKCFENVARHLTPDGVFLIEAFVPDIKRFIDGQALRVIGIEPDRLRLDAAEVDFAAQRITARHVHLSAAGVEIFPVQLRYIWPAEMDLMARLAGLRLHQRWSSWDMTPFTSGSMKNISIYARL